MINYTRNGTQIDVRYFSPHEFERGGRNWWPAMSIRWLMLMDSIRATTGAPHFITNSAGALGREQGDRLSQHNAQKWGEVRAGDFTVQGVRDGKDAAEYVSIARLAGITGIGVYAGVWNVPVGFHCDVRMDRNPGDPATWGRVLNELGQIERVSIEEALAAIGV